MDRILNTKEIYKLVTGDKLDSGLFLLTGEEEFFMTQVISAIKKKCIAEGAESMDFVKIDFQGKEMDVEKVRENVELPPWMSPKRMVLVCNADVFGEKKDQKDKKDKKDNKPGVSELCSHIPGSTVLVITVPKIDKRKKELLKAFTDNGIVAEITYQDVAQLENYINKVFSKNGLSSDPVTVGSIVDRCNRSMRLISNELGKITLYCAGTGTTVVSMEIVDDICPPDIQGKIFTITDAIGNGNVKTALTVMDNLIKMKEPVTKIRFMTARHIRMLICAKELGNVGEISKRLGTRDFVARNLINQARGFTYERLTGLYLDFLQTDRDIKKGVETDERTALEVLIVKAAQR